MARKQDKFNEIVGAGGGKGGRGKSPVEAPNTLSSRAIVKVVEVLSEGEIEGIVGGGRGVYINNTPLENADGTTNFARAMWDYRVGLPSQDYLQGFPSVEAEYAVGTNVTTNTPVTRTSSAASIDAVRVTIALPQGLYSLDTSNGNMNGTSVSFAIDTKLTSSGTWTQYGNTYSIGGKTTSATEKQYRIERPLGAGTWDVRVRRITVDSVKSSLKNNIALARVTEVQDIKLSYNDTAYVGIAIDSETVGGQVPSRAYLVKGVKVKVPTNYDPLTRVYTGQWDGTFKQAWTDNPAWCLYDLITHPRYGMGEYISEAHVDKFSFYDAAVYSDAGIVYNQAGVRVSGGVPDGKGGFEPRFTFNAVLSERNDALRWVMMIAGVMRAQIMYIGGLVTLIQDSPMSAQMVVNKSNVIEGFFDYKSTGLFERHTEFNVTYNDREDRHLQRVTTVSDTAGIARYGLNPTDIAAFGATTEGQAIRFGKWALDTEMNQTEIVQFRMSLNGFGLKPGDIVSIFDEDYTATAGGGRVVSVSGTNVVLDRPVAITTGSKIDILLADGKTVEQRNVVSANGTAASITINAAFSQAVSAQAPYVMTTAVAPRQFKIMALSQTEPNIIAIEAVEHDPNKYSRVELGISVPSPVFTASVAVICTAPTSLLFREVSVNIDNTIRRSLLVSWQPPLQGVVKGYNIRYRSNVGEWITAETKGPTYTIDPVASGTYEVQVSAVSINNMNGPTADGIYTIQSDAGGASPLAAPTTLVEQNGGGTAFGTPDLNFKWTNPLSNADVLTATLRDFQVRFVDTVTNTTVRTDYVPPVAAGSIQTWAYSYAANLAETGGVNARRSIKVEVRCRDTSGNLSAAAITTFTNAAPAVPSNIVLTGALQSVKMTLTLPTEPDFKGILVWMSTSNNFTPSSGNLLYDGSDSYIAFNALSDVSTYYFRVAAYDTYGKTFDGAGLNLSAQLSATTSAAPGIAQVASLPGSGTEGDVVFNTTDGKLYRYHAGAWTAKVPTVDLLGTVADAQIAAVAATKITGQVTDTQVAAVAAAKVTGQLVDSQVAALAASKLTGTVADAQIGSIGAGKITGTLTSAQIADLAAAKLTGTITTTQITDSAINTAKLAAGSVVAAKIAAGAVTTDKLLVGSVGAALNADPGFLDPAAWSTAGTFVTVSDGKVGTKALREGPNSTSTTQGLQAIPVDANKVYRVRCWARNINSNGILYMGVVMYDAAGNAIAGNGSYHYVGAIGSTVPAAWTEFVGYLNGTGMTIPANARVMRIMVLNNYASTTGSMEVQDLRIEEMLPSTLIQDGAITTNKILARSIIADRIAAGAITANEVAASTITGDKIAGGTITGTNIAGSTITGSNIVAGTLTAGHIAADTINASHIQAGAVGASEIQANSITAKNLVLYNKDSVDPDPGFYDPTYWAPGYGGSWPANVGPTSDPSYPASRVLLFSPGSSVSMPSRTFVVEKGANYRVKVMMWKNAGTTGPFTAVLHVPGVIYHSLGIPRTGSATIGYNNDIDWNAIPSNQWVTYENVVQQGYTYDWFQHIIAGQITAGAVYIAIQITLMSGASLIVDGAITTNKVAANTIVASHIQSDQINAAHIIANSIGANELAADSVIAGKVAAGAIGAAQIVAGSITGDRIAGNTITGDKVQAGTITANNIAGASITGDKVAANTLTGDKVAANTLTANKLSVGSLSAITAVIGTLRTATSGQRTEIRDNVIKMYDASNVLRIQMGDLTL